MHKGLEIYAWCLMSNHLHMNGNHPEIIYNSRIFYQKLKYIHKNPVKEMIVANPEDYYFSSARNYAGLSNILPVILEIPELISY